MVNTVSLDQYSGLSAVTNLPQLSVPGIRCRRARHGSWNAQASALHEADEA